MGANTQAPFFYLWMCCLPICPQAYEQATFFPLFLCCYFNFGFIVFINHTFFVFALIVLLSPRHFLDFILCKYIMQRMFQFQCFLKEPSKYKTLKFRTHCYSSESVQDEARCTQLDIEQHRFDDHQNEYAAYNLLHPKLYCFHQSHHWQILETVVRLVCISCIRTMGKNVTQIFQCSCKRGKFL